MNGNMTNIKRNRVSAMSVTAPFFSFPPLRWAMALLSLMLLAGLSTAQAGDNGLTVTIPNGYANVHVEDLQVQSTAGPVRWKRLWDGQEWKFNPHWESLSQSWKNLTGNQTADTTSGSLVFYGGGLLGAGPAPSDCSIWVDEGWQPAAANAPMQPERTTPFNRAMGGSATDYPSPVRIMVNYANLCAGSGLSNSINYVEGFRRLSELYLGNGVLYAFSNRYTLEKRTIRALPTTEATTLTSQLATGSMTLASVANSKGFRWMDRDGSWIDYNTQGQVVAYGDKNDNTVWLARDTGGMVRGVVDDHGRVLLTLHYTGSLLTEVRDYPMAGNPLDLPQRSVKYQYDGNNRLTQVTDVRGNTTRYNYDTANHITTITDQEGRAEQLAYNSDMVAKRTAPDGGVTDYAFSYDDANKQYASKITGPTTAAGRRVVDYTHNRSAKLSRLIVNGRTDEEVGYDIKARVEVHTNARGFSTRITRNEFEQVVQVDQPDGTTVKRSYSALNLKLTEKIDEAGFKTDYLYDNNGNLLKKTEAAGTADERVTEYAVNSLGQTIKLTRKGRTESNGTVTADAVWQIEYDVQGKINKTTDPEGNVRQYAYNRAGNLASYTNPLDHTTRFEVDADGNLVNLTDALRRIKHFEYDKVGNLTQYTDARSKTWQAAYDAMNRFTQTTNPVGGISKLQYNAAGLPTSVADADGHAIQLGFDSFLRLTQLTDALNNQTVFGYNIPDGSAAGTLGSLTIPTTINYPTFTQNKRLDQRERPTIQTLINANRTGTQNLTSSTSYDQRGLINSDTNANGKSRSYSYDALGQLTAYTDALGYKTQALFDARGNLIQLTDAKGNVNRFEFDRNNRVVKEILPLGQTTTYQYDAAGNLTQRKDAKGNNTTYAYNAANRLQKIQQFQGNTQLVRTTDFTWDEADNLTAWSDTDTTRPSGQQTASSSVTYDDANRKTAETVTYPNPAGGDYSLGYGYQYSPAGKKTRLVWADGTAIDYGYSAHGKLNSVIIPGEGSLSVNQFRWMAPATVTLPGGSAQQKSYDGLLNLEGFKVKSSGQQTLLDLSNHYGKRQELTSRSRTDTLGGNSSTVTGQFSYDNDLRLTQSITGSPPATETETFTLDAVGNRTAHSKVTGPWSYDADNRLIQRGAAGSATYYQYDDAGNLTQKTEPTGRVTQFGYDTRNRLIEVKDGSGNLIARYGYDPLDRRIWKETYSTAGQGVRTYYLYADEGLIAEATQNITPPLPMGEGWGEGSAATTQPTITTQYGPRPNGLFGTGMLFVKTKNSNRVDSFAYYHYDHLGSPIQATDKNDNVVWAAQYNVFGQVVITTPVATSDIATIISNIRLPGQVEDDETGLHYNWHRYYDPSAGRYITQDPVGFYGGFNKYSYAIQNPIFAIDPNGMGFLSKDADPMILYPIIGFCMLQPELCLLGAARATAPIISFCAVNPEFCLDTFNGFLEAILVKNTGGYQSLVSCKLPKNFDDALEDAISEKARDMSIDKIVNWEDTIDEISNILNGFEHPEPPIYDQSLPPPGSIRTGDGWFIPPPYDQF